jgi:hypothetical protein
VVGCAKSLENSDFAMDINEINVELSENSQRYVNECCESESDGKIDGFGAGCCKRRGGSPLLCGESGAITFISPECGGCWLGLLFLLFFCFSLLCYVISLCSHVRGVGRAR